MNKKELEKYLPEAYKILKDYQVENHYNLFETQLATFGSAIAMGNIAMAKKLFSDRFKNESEGKLKNVYIARRNILCMWGEMLKKLGVKETEANLSESLKALTLLRMGLLYFKKPEKTPKNDQDRDQEQTNQNRMVREFKECSLSEDFFSQLPKEVAQNSKNLSYRFYAGNFDDYKDIIRNIPSEIENPYKSLIEEIETNEKGVFYDETTGFGYFTLKVTYPGLVTGLGILYENSAENGVKSGFSFDYNTGLPFIQGSNVKGRLKSICEDLSSQEKDEAESSLEKTLGESFDKSAISVDTLRIQISNAENKYFKGSLSDFMKSCFGGSGENEQGEDIFFDAFVNKVDCIDEDFVTKHDKDNLKEPNPARFLRIKPGTEITFIFKLTDYKNNGAEINAIAKLALFKQLLMDYGIGAKTNKGYGYLEDRSSYV